MSRKSYEMPDTSPEGPQKSYKYLIIVLILLVVAGGTVFAMTRDSYNAAKFPPTASQQASDTSKGATTPGGGSPAVNNNQQTQTVPQTTPAGNTTAAPSTITQVQTVHFDFDSASLLAGENAKVKDFWTKIKDAKGTVHIDGYTDNLGSHEYNSYLSERRAKTIESLLKQLGTGNQLTFTLKGNAEANPVGDNTTKEGRALNRRAEVKFTPSN